MATINVTFRDRNGKPVASTSVVGRKMPKSWIDKIYGPNEYISMYRIRKKNEYGIVWLSLRCSRMFGECWDIYTDKKHSTDGCSEPKHDWISVVRVN